MGWLIKIGPRQLVHLFFLQAVIVTAYFGGLRHTETEALIIENFISTSDGVIVTHSRAKVTFILLPFSYKVLCLQQRSDMKDTRFLIPRQEGSGPNYSKIVESYLEKVKLDLCKQSGRVWFTGRHSAFVPLLMGKNTISKVNLSYYTLLNCILIYCSMIYHIIL